MSQHAQLPHRERRTILLIDDHADVRASLALLLRWSGEWQVVGEAGDCASALSLAAGRCPDVVLLDRWLADGDGLWLAPRLLSLARPPQIVLLTAEPELSTRAEVRDLGIAQCLDKLMPPLDLLAALRAIPAPPAESRG